MKPVTKDRSVWHGPETVDLTYMDRPALKLPIPIGKLPPRKMPQSDRLWAEKVRKAGWR